MAKKNFNIFGAIFAVLGIAGVSAGIVYLRNNAETNSSSTTTSESGKTDSGSEENPIVSDLKITLYDRSYDSDNGTITYEYVYNVIGTKSSVLTYSFENQNASNYLSVRLQPLDKTIFVDIINPFNNELQVNFVTDTNVQRSIFVNIRDFLITEISTENPSIIF